LTVFYHNTCCKQQIINKSATISSYDAEGAEEDCASWFNVQKPQVLFMWISHDFFDRSSEKT